MAKKSWKNRARTGQALVETAIALPIVIIVMFMILQCGWLAFCGTTLSSAIASAQYSVTAERAAHIGADAALEEQIRESSPIFATGTLTVTGTDIEQLPSATRSADLPDAEFDAYRFATKNESTARVAVTSHVEYTPISLYGGIIRPRFVREVAASRISEERFELG